MFWGCSLLLHFLLQSPSLSPSFSVYLVFSPKIHVCRQRKSINEIYKYYSVGCLALILLVQCSNIKLWQQNLVPNVGPMVTRHPLTRDIITSDHLATINLHPIANHIVRKMASKCSSLLAKQVVAGQFWVNCTTTWQLQDHPAEPCVTPMTKGRLGKGTLPQRDIGQAQILEPSNQRGRGSPVEWSVQEKQMSLRGLSEP